MGGGGRRRGGRNNVAAARELRQRLTPAEAVLWRALRDRRAGGAKFRRQHPVGPFVLDFCDPTARLAVEVDGGVHDGQADADGDRTELLAAAGYRVLRFRNDEVLGNLGSVLDRIAQALGVANDASACAPHVPIADAFPAPIQSVSGER